jgi:exfoliative toxin A/B
MSAPKNDGKLRRIASKTPVPLAGLMLGLSSVGNMVPEFQWFFGFFAFTILAFLIVKFTLDTKTLKEEFKNPAIAGIACTMTMATSVLSTYLKPFSVEVAIGMWIASMIVHLGFMAYFTRSFIIKFDLEKCLPCYFVVYVGFAVNAFIAPVYGYFESGQALFWFGLASLLLLLPPLAYRTLVVKRLPDAMVPTIMIFAAPTNVCLNAYLKAFPSPDQGMVWTLFALACVLYAGCLVILPRILRLPFFPSYSSLTFPLAISGIATNATYQYFLGMDSDMPVLQYLAWFQTAMAVVFVLYVLMRYIYHFLVKPWTSAKTKDALPGTE